MLQHKNGLDQNTDAICLGVYNTSNQTYPNKGYDIEKAIVLSVVFIIVLNAAIFVDKKLLKRSLSHGKNRTDRSE